MKILIIEDEKLILSFLESNLNTYGFVTDGAGTGECALKLIRENLYDLIIMDLGLPDLNGRKLCELLRSEGYTMPILVLTGDEEVESKVNLLNLGVDDYMTKPFSMQELVARIKALSRRPIEISGDCLIKDDLELDCQRQTVKRAGKEIHLTRKEFLLLEYMMRHPDTVISRGEIMEHIWDMEANFFSKTIETHILNLRKKVDVDRPEPLIRTVSGRGYKFG